MLMEGGGLGKTHRRETWAEATVIEMERWGHSSGISREGTSSTVTREMDTTAGLDE